MPPTQNSPTQFPIRIKKHLKVVAIVFTILLVCGFLAFGISSILWYILEPPSGIEQPTLTPTKWSWKPFVENTTLTKDLPSVASCGKRIVGYYTEWESLEITSKQLRKLTHVIFLFVAIYEDGSARFWNDHGEDRFLEMKKAAAELKNGLKVMIGVGGYMVSPRFGPIVADKEKRKKLINDTIAIIDEHNLDGVEVFWFHPAASEKRDYVKLIKELREGLSILEQTKKRDEPYILSIVAPKVTAQLKDGYDLDKLLEYVDFIDVLTYDYFNVPTSWGKRKLGPTAPLYGGNERNVDETMKYLVCKTGKPERINMAVSFYGNVWINVKNPIRGNDIWRDTTTNHGAVRWKELEKSGFNKSDALWHEKSKSSYIYLPESKTFMGFENERSLKEKIKYNRKRNLGGFVIWAIDQDDKDYTLLNVVTSAELCSSDTTDIVKYDC
ncbi:unnamed protein product [Caenorhabditis brenneri]